jgi:hypothetical protein
LECLSILLAAGLTVGWMLSTSYADYMLTQLYRQDPSQVHSIGRLSLKFLNLPWGYGQWMISSIILFIVFLVLGIINIWLLLIPGFIGALAMGSALYGDVQCITQIVDSLPQPQFRPTGYHLIAEPSLEAQVKLVGLRGEHARRTLEFYSQDQEILIGRSSQNQVQLSESSVSRVHARIVCADRHWYVQDLKSKTGVYVNGKKITGGLRIHQHDHIRIGSSEYEFLHR